jgi:hypothetical protein
MDAIRERRKKAEMTLQIPLSKAQANEGANRVDIRDRQREPEAASPAS